MGGRFGPFKPRQRENRPPRLPHEPRSRLSETPVRYHVELRESAHEDLEDIWRYIARGNPLNAERYIAKIHDAIGRLTLLPNTHGEPPGLAGLGVRQLLVGSHRALFFVYEPGRTVAVVRILHTSESTEKYETELRQALD